MQLDESRKIILFGAGRTGMRALEYFGAQRVAYFADNNLGNAGKSISGIGVISFDRMKELSGEYEIVLAVGGRLVAEMAEQLEKNGIQNYVYYYDLFSGIRGPGNQRIDCSAACERALRWVKRNSIPDKGIINNSDYRTAYPEVTGYFIPTLMRCGERELAITYAKWLCAIQHEDGSWYDTEGIAPYVFDTAQILKGLLAVRETGLDVDGHIRKGCEWIVSNVNSAGRLLTPTKEAWGAPGVCSELIHLYCLSPLIEAGRLYEEDRYVSVAEKVMEYYIANFREEILGFGFLSHFYAYVMEALCDLGQTDLAREAMGRIASLQRADGMVPAYRDVNWTCSTGMFQLAVTWYKLGDSEHGDSALAYGMSLQNETGGWNGSYAAAERLRPTHKEDYPAYFATSEISWAVKYFLDAVYYKSHAGKGVMW